MPSRRLTRIGPFSGGLVPPLVRNVMPVLLCCGILLAAAGSDAIATPSGACCLYGGICQIMQEQFCTLAQGTYQGDNTLCTPDPCGGTLGACCVPGNCYILDEVNCAQLSGTWYSGLPCAPDPCGNAEGACCHDDGSCTVVLDGNCNAAGGYWLGQGTACDPDPCAALTGACCDGATCTTTTRANCAQQWLGPSSTCDPNPCQSGPTGACCAGPMCVLVSEAVCTEGGGTYHGDGTVCDPNPCPGSATGACCFGNQVCEVLASAYCTGQDVTYMGDGTTCTPNPCPPEPTKPSTWGRIKGSYR